MRLFSILQHTLPIAFQGGHFQQAIEFSEDPNDSSNVRLRATQPTVDGVMPDDGEAVEIVFDRNGRERSRRAWPLNLPAWETEAETAKRLAKEAEAAASVEAEPIDTSTGAEAVDKPKKGRRG